MLDRIKNIPPTYYLVPLGLIAIFVAWTLLPVDEWIQSMSEWVKGLGAWGVIIFGLIYVLGTVLLAPGAPLSIAAGLIFKWWGFPIVIVSATIGATLAFIVGRYIARRRVEQAIEQRPKFKAVDRAVADEGWKIVGMVRLSPLVPFNLQNYFFGTTNVGLLPYVIATAIGIMPGGAVFVYLGSIGAASGGQGGALKWTLLGAGLVTTIVVTWFVSRRAQARLAEHGLDADD